MGSFIQLTLARLKSSHSIPKKLGWHLLTGFARIASYHFGLSFLQEEQSTPLKQWSYKQVGWDKEAGCNPTSAGLDRTISRAALSTQIGSR